MGKGRERGKQQRKKAPAPSPASFKVGQRVKVTDSNCWAHGYEGEVAAPDSAHQPAGEGSVFVTLDAKKHQGPALFKRDQVAAI